MFTLNVQTFYACMYHEPMYACMQYSTIYVRIYVCNNVYVLLNSDTLISQYLIFVTIKVMDLEKRG